MATVADFHSAADAVIEALLSQHARGWYTVQSATKAVRDSYAGLSDSIVFLDGKGRDKVLLGTWTVERWGNEAARIHHDAGLLAGAAYDEGPIADCIAFLRDVVVATGGDVAVTVKNTAKGFGFGAGFAVVVLAALGIFVLVKRR